MPSKISSGSGDRAGQSTVPMMRPACCWSAMKKSTSSISTVTVKLHAWPASLPRRAAVSYGSVTVGEMKPAMRSVNSTPAGRSVSRPPGAAMSIGASNFCVSEKRQPRSLARWIIARSAIAVMVSSGLTPSGRGMTEPSHT